MSKPPANGSAPAPAKPRFSTLELLLLAVIAAVVLITAALLRSEGSREPSRSAPEPPSATARRGIPTATAWSHRGAGAGPASPVSRAAAPAARASAPGATGAVVVASWPPPHTSVAVNAAAPVTNPALVAAGSRPGASTQTAAAARASTQTAAANKPSRMDALKAAIDAAESQQRKVQQLFASMSNEEIQQAVRLVESMEWGPQANLMFQALIGRWGEVDFTSAIDYAMGFTSRRIRNAAVNNALAGWSRKDAQSAYDWFMQNLGTDPSALGMSVGTLFRNMAGQDADWSLAKVWSLPGAGLRRSALDAVMEQMFDKMRDQDVIARYDTLTDSDQRVMMAEAIVRRVSRYRPQEAADWIASLEDPAARQAATSRLVDAWAYDRPLDAAEWVLSLPDAKSRYAQVARLVGVWAKDDPTQASAWLNQFPSSLQLDPAVENLVRNSMSQDYPGAMDWAESVVSTTKRQALIQEVAWAWLKKDYQAALGYIVQSELPDPVKKRFLKRAAGMAPKPAA
jgi:hypothetical protein